MTGQLPPALGYLQGIDADFWPLVLAHPVLCGGKNSFETLIFGKDVPNIFSTHSIKPVQIYLGLKCHTDKNTDRRTQSLTP